MKAGDIYKYKYDFLFIKLLREGSDFMGIKKWEIEVIDGNQSLIKYFESKIGESLLESTILNLFDIF